jgi:hypothetical protein
MVPRIEELLPSKLQGTALCFPFARKCGLERPQKTFWARKRGKGGVVPAHFDVLPAPTIRNAARSTASHCESCSDRQGEREGERPGELHVSDSVHLQRAEDPHKMRRFSTWTVRKICLSVAIFAPSQQTSLTENLFLTFQFRATIRVTPRGWSRQRSLLPCRLVVERCDGLSIPHCKLVFALTPISQLPPPNPPLRQSAAGKRLGRRISHDNAGVRGREAPGCRSRIKTLIGSFEAQEAGDFRVPKTFRQKRTGAQFAIFASDTMLWFDRRREDSKEFAFENARAHFRVA